MINNMPDITGVEFSRAAHVSRSAITQARNKGIIIQNESGLYDPDHPDNAAYLLKHVQAFENKKAVKKEEKASPKTKNKKGDNKSLSEVEIFIQALSFSLAESDITKKQQNKLKKDMIKNAEKIEADQEALKN